VGTEALDMVFWEMLMLTMGKVAWHSRYAVLVMVE
jgi:hypothetical protein